MFSSIYRLSTLALGMAICLTVAAQPKSIIGKVVNKSTGEPIGNGTIRNVNNGKTVMAKSNGTFIIDAARGQILALTANGFYTDTLTITDTLLKTIGLRLELKPLPTTLQTVVVSASQSPYQRDSLARREEFLALVGKTVIPAISRTNDLGFGVGINLDRLGKTEKRKHRARELFEILEEDAYVNYRWTETLVEKYTNFKGEQLFAFMQDYQPTYSWLRKHVAEEDLMYYINDKLKKSRKG
ncbi:MAG: hypothetical protein EAY75_01645 [Bacteroidetes bacterium]|nr:MAG: hypothetical protein EAY75_01645 [Bacteroidota bacterium]